MIYPLIIYGLVVLALLAAELREDKRAQALFKPLGALGFILIAIKVGALETVYGQIILAGLIACALGDVLLLSRKSQKLFIAGMAAFALGHVLYGLAFLKQGVIFDASPRTLGLGLFIIINAGCSLAPILVGTSKIDRVSILIYGGLITTMIILAFVTNNWLIIAGAILFAVSDFFVGMDRFQDRKKWHPIAITPLYFGAQLLFALSTQI